jgi:hypothetical protein
MMRLAAAVIALAVIAGGAWLALRPGAPDPAEGCSSEGTLTAPSGRELTLCEVVLETQPSGETWAVIRVLDPELPATRETVEVTDHDWACETWGFDMLATEPRPTRIVVQIMAERFERGEPAPGIIQTIEAYSEQNGACMWELL